MSVGSNPIQTKAATFYPNPFSAFVTVNVEEASVTNSSELILYNVLGKQVMNQTLTNTSTTVETNLPSGVYFYKVINKDGGVQSGKLIAQ